MILGGYVGGWDCPLVVIREVIAELIDSQIEVSFVEFASGIVPVYGRG